MATSIPAPRPQYPNASPRSSQACAIEQLPSVNDRVNLLWARAGFADYVNHLLMDSRDGERRGLPLAAVDELQFLLTLNALRRAMDMAATEGIPLSVARQRIAQEQLAEVKIDGDSDEWGSQFARRGERLDADIAIRTTPAPVAATRAPAQAPPPKRRTGNVNPFSLLAQGIVRLMTSRYVIIVIIVALALKALWPTLKNLTYVFR